jgi:hypothetical protein
MTGENVPSVRSPTHPEGMVMAACDPVSPTKAATAPAEVTAVTSAGNAPRLTSFSVSAGWSAGQSPTGPAPTGRPYDPARVDHVPGASVALAEPWPATPLGSTSSNPGTDSHLHLTAIRMPPPGGIGANRDQGKENRFHEGFIPYDAERDLTITTKDRHRKVRKGRNNPLARPVSAVG